MLLLTRSLKVSDDWTCQTSSYAAQHKRGRISTFSFLLFPSYCYRCISCNSKENLGRPLSFSNGGREQVKNMEIERQTYCCELAAISRQEKKTFHEPIIISFGAEEEEEEIKIKSWSYY